jgi:hypothetical protein
MSEKGVQTKPDMKIDLSSVMFDKLDSFPLIDPNIDIDLSEAFIPFPGMIIDTATAIANYYPLCLG